MKRKIAIVLAVAMAAACLCLAGCSGGLSDADFDFYDADGNVTQEFNTGDRYSQSILMDDEEYTLRGIGVGSTLEEVEAAYEEIWESVRRIEHQLDDGDIGIWCSWLVGENVFQIILINDEVSACHSFTESWAHSTEFYTLVRLTDRWNFEELITGEGRYRAFWETLTEEEIEVLHLLNANEQLRCQKRKQPRGNYFSTYTMEEGWGEITFLTDEEKKLAESAYEKFKENYDFGY